jgi:hypothetical protein
LYKLLEAKRFNFSPPLLEMSQTRKLKKPTFFPTKYFKGLSKTKKAQRKKEIQKYGAMNWKSRKAYKGFKTDIGVKTKKSQYTQAWDTMFPGVKSLKDRSKVTGVPEDLLQKSYDRGLAAWRTGHRPGATQGQWGYARVSSMLMLGKTAYTTDSDLVEEAKKRSAKARAWFKKMELTSKVKFTR